MTQDNKNKQSRPRSEVEIFEELRELAKSDGMLHFFSRLVYRDQFITVDRYKGHVVDDPEHRWSTSKLNKNELLLLLGLMVQSTTERIYLVPPVDDDFLTRVDALFSEFHQRLFENVTLSFDPKTTELGDPKDIIGEYGREAIYYGADGLYLHQLLNFSRIRYEKDMEWFLRNVGISICQIFDITKFILDRINDQMTEIGHRYQKGHEIGNFELTNSLLISKEDVRKKFGKKAEAYFSKFVTPIRNANLGFTNPFAINEVALAPIIEMGDHLYVPIQYRLCESIYESPFFWMMADQEYADIHAKHRGEFLEETAAGILQSVFGPQNVHENVVVTWNGRDRVGEIDVLVEYGEFVVVVQAKSKRITLNARAGDTRALEVDFDSAIQDPYRQALECINHIKGGAKCITKDGNELEIPHLPRFFPMVVLSDPFPASTTLTHALLKRDNDIAPVIWDIGVLDCVSRMLPIPIEMLFYLKCRSDTFDRVISDSEFNYLGYHIQNKLALSPEIEMLKVERENATVVDNFMIAADLGINADRPTGILESLELPVISDLLLMLKTADPRVVALVADLRDFSKDGLETLSKTIIEVRKEITKTKKEFKAISIPTMSGGLTYAVTFRWDKKIASAAEEIGRKHKYTNKSDRWYVIVDCIKTEIPVDSLIILVWPWKKDKNEDAASQKITEIFKSSKP